MPDSIYFISDLHLGVPDSAASHAREHLFIKWLNEVKQDAEAIYIMGDLFDFWFEYKQVVPKGFVRTLGTLALLKDAGLPIYFFTGNHDQWMADYFEKELGIPVYHNPIKIELQGKKVFMGHGDGLGPGDEGYKFLKRFFTSAFFRGLFALIHPNFGVWLGKKWSYDNKWLNGVPRESFVNEESEWLIRFCKDYLKTNYADYFVFGHRHLAMEVHLTEDSTYYNLGDWLSQFTYVKMTDGVMQLLKFK